MELLGADLNGQDSTHVLRRLQTFLRKYREGVAANTDCKGRITTTVKTEIRIGEFESG